MLRDVWVQIPSPAPRAVLDKRAALFRGAEQDKDITARVIDLFSGFEGSPPQSHSRLSSLDILVP